MNILYCSCLCTEKTFLEASIKLGSQQVQKYHRLLIKGLNKQKNLTIKALSKLVSPDIPRHKKIAKIEEWNGINIRYIVSRKVGILGHIKQCGVAFLYVLFHSKKNTIVCLDILNTAMNVGIVLASKLKGLSIIGIVTDLPEHVVPNTKSSKIGSIILDACAGYLLLTEMMNDVINPLRKKPFVVIEGQVDSSMLDFENSLDKKIKPRVFMYAGDFLAKNGIRILINGFIKARLENTELHIYGGGEEEQFVKSICMANPNIKYFGYVLNEEIVQKEVQSTLLINPRPSNQDFVKYSFPSKLMEYMVSGTPVLTTRLCGISKEYYPYIYTIDTEDEDGICCKLQELSKLTDYELNEKGKLLKQFVIKEKNEVKQAEKFYCLLQKFNSK